MSPEWQERLSRIGLGVLFGRKPAEVVTAEAKDLAKQEIQDHAGLALLPAEATEHIRNAISLVQVAKSKALQAKPSLPNLAELQLAEEELKAVIK